MGASETPGAFSVAPELSRRQLCSDKPRAGAGEGGAGGGALPAGFGVRAAARGLRGAGGRGGLPVKRPPRIRLLPAKRPTSQFLLGTKIPVLGFENSEC